MPRNRTRWLRVAACNLKAGDTTVLGEHVTGVDRAPVTLVTLDTGDQCAYSRHETVMVTRPTRFTQ